MKLIQIGSCDPHTRAVRRVLFCREIGVASCFLVSMLFVAAAHAEPARAPQSLIAGRVATLRQARDVFREAAASALPARLSDAELAEARHYLDWLRTWADKLERLAAKGDSARDAAERSSGQDPSSPAGRQLQELIQSFNQQYLQLQQQMQEEYRRFTLVSNIMKKSHDTASRAINNIR
jgi:hypothetical protein